MLPISVTFLKYSFKRKTFTCRGSNFKLLLLLILKNSVCHPAFRRGGVCEIPVCTNRCSSLKFKAQPLREVLFKPQYVGLCRGSPARLFHFAFSSELPRSFSDGCPGCLCFSRFPTIITYVLLVCD